MTVTGRSGPGAAPEVVLEVIHLRAAADPDAPPQAQRRAIRAPGEFVHGDPSLAAGRAVGLLDAHAEATASGAEWIHSTSWRVDGRSVVLTFLAYGADEARTAGWSELDPVDPASAPDRSQGLTYAAVLHHAMRHLAFLALRSPSLAAQIAAHGLSRVLRADPLPAGLIPEPITD